MPHDHGCQSCKHFLLAMSTHLLVMIFVSIFVSIFDVIILLNDYCCMEIKLKKGINLGTRPILSTRQIPNVIQCVIEVRLKN